MQPSFRLFVGVAAVIVVAVLATVAVWWHSTPVVTDDVPAPVLDPLVPEVVAPTSTTAVIGASVEGRVIEAYSFGTGETDLLFVGGIHGGYEWNSVLLAHEMIDYFAANYWQIPENLTLTIIPNLNPDGVAAVTGGMMQFTAADVQTDPAALAQARFNSNAVDLNRNFDCKWAPESTWRGQPVSAGTAAFSEPEAVALRDYVLLTQPAAVVFWHSQANTVYASECEAGVLPETLALMNTYAAAAEYNTQATFDAYPITGDAEGWLASIGIPAITVELETRTSTEWQRNIRGVLALVNYYTAPQNQTAD